MSIRLVTLTALFAVACTSQRTEECARLRAVADETPQWDAVASGPTIDAQAGAWRARAELASARAERVRAIAATTSDIANLREELASRFDEMRTTATECAAMTDQSDMSVCGTGFRTQNAIRERFVSEIDTACPE
jgi:hypothetical protein